MAVDDKKPAGVPDGWEVVTPAPHDAKPEERSAIDRFVEGAWKNTGGAVIGTMKALVPSAVAEAAGADDPGSYGPAHAIKGLIDAHADQLDKAKAAYKEGRYSEAAGHLAAAAVPGVGPAAANAGEKIGAGDVAGGLGEAAGILAPAAHAPIGRAVEAVRGPVGRAVSAVGRGVENVGTGRVGEFAAGTGAYHQAMSGNIIGAAASAAAPAVATGAGKVLQFIGGKISREAAAAGMSDLDFARQEFAAGRLPPAVMKGIERAAAQRAAQASPVARPATAPASALADAPIVESGASSPAAELVDPRQQAVLPDTRPPAATQADIDAAQASNAAGYVAPPTDPATVGAAAPPPAAVSPAPQAPPPGSAVSDAAVAERKNFSPQKALNEIALGARRLKIKLTGAEERAAVDLVKGGAATKDALAAVVQQRVAGSSVFAGLPSDAEVAARVSDRNATGRWSEISGKMGGRGK